MIFRLIFLSWLVTVILAQNANKKNIVMLIADDLGWEDVSFHGSNQIQTPNIDVLASSGLILQRYYTHSLCTPSRSAIMTGKFAYKLGMQGYPLTNGEERGLPLSEKILPQYFKELGYDTHLVGKWHVGHHQMAYLPTFRGYDTHYGHRSGLLDYYEYTDEENWPIGKVTGFCLFRNVTPDWEAEGYLTDIYNNEALNVIQNHNTDKPLLLTVAYSAPHSGNDGSLLQAPPEVVRKMRYIESPERKVLAAMIKKLDDSVGDIVEALHLKGILNNTLIMFISDNGGPYEGEIVNWASNRPLRGAKFSPWEGGIRVVGSIWSPELNNRNSIWQGYMHSVDWLPTLLGSINVDVSTEIDGVNQWTNLLEEKDSDRNLIVEIDDLDEFAAIIEGDYKLVVANKTIEKSGYYGSDLTGVIRDPPSYVETVQESKACKVFEETMGFNLNYLKIRRKTKFNCIATEDICMPDAEKSCLFNIKDDPCENQDLSVQFPEKVNELKEKLNKEMEKRIPRTERYRDPRALPKFFDYTWTTWNEPQKI